MSKEVRCREEIIGLLCASSFLTYDEIFEKVSGKGCTGFSRELIRLALAHLVREGVVYREPDYERARMVFRADRRICG